MKKRIAALFAAFALTVPSALACVPEAVSAESENPADYTQKLKAAYDPYNKTDVFEVREAGMYFELNNPSNSGVNFKQRHLKEQPFSLSFVNPVYSAEGGVLDGEYYRTSVQISLKDKNNTLRFNFGDSVGSGNTSVFSVLLYIGSDCYTFREEIIGNMTEAYEYGVRFDYNAAGMISTRTVNSVETDIFNTVTYSTSAFSSNVAGETTAEKTETFNSLIKETFASTVYFEPYIQLWGDLGGGESKRRFYITEHNGQRFDGGTAYEYVPYISEIRQDAAVVENSSFRLCFTGDTAYLVDPTKFATNTPGYMPEFYGMIMRDGVYNSNIMNIKASLIKEDAKTEVYNGTGWNTGAIAVGEAGEYSLELTITNAQGKSYTRVAAFEVVKADRLELRGALCASANEGESISFPEALVVSNNVLNAEKATLSVVYTAEEGGASTSVNLTENTVESAQAGVYTATWTSGSLVLEREVRVYADGERLVGLQINKPPTKLLYTVGESFDDAGLMIQKKFADGSLEEIWGGYFVVTNEPLKVTDKAVVIGLTVDGVTAYLAIPVVVEVPEVTELAVESVSVVVPCKLIYVAGESAALAGLKLRVIFNDNSELIVDGGFVLAKNEALKEGDSSIDVEFTARGFALSYRLPIVVDGAQKESREKSGCGSALGGSALILLSALMLIILLRKNRENG